MPNDHGRKNDRPRFRLFDPDHHRVRAYQVLDVALAEARVGHPGAAVCTRVVEPDRPLNQHVETHQESKSVRAPIIVDDRVVNDQPPAIG